MSVAPNGPNRKTVLKITGQLPYKTGRKHGKTLQKTGVILDGEQAGLFRN